MEMAPLGGRFFEALVGQFVEPPALGDDVCDGEPSLMAGGPGGEFPAFAKSRWHEQGGATLVRIEAGERVGHRPGVVRIGSKHAIHDTSVFRINIRKFVSGRFGCRGVTRRRMDLEV